MTSIFILAFLGAPEIIVVLAIVLLLFGGKKIPEMMKGIGKGIKDFKDASKAEGIPVEKDLVKEPVDLK